MRLLCFPRLPSIVIGVGLVASLVPAFGQPVPARHPGSPPPVSYRRWLEEQPPHKPLEASVVYSTPAAPAAKATAPSSLVRNYLVLVNDSLYYGSAEVRAALETYIDDVEHEGLTVELVALSCSSAESLRDLIKSKYSTLPNLEGMALVGDLPHLWYSEPEEPDWWSFPCDMYLTDLDGDWHDTNGDGLYNEHTAGAGDEGPEIYHGRITACGLTLDPGQNEVSLLTRYFDKVHRYRQGLMGSNGRACLYIDDPWRWWTDQYATEMAQAWPDIDRYDDPYETIASDYLQKIQVRYEHLRVNVHYGAYGHGFGIPPEQHGGDVSAADLVAHPPKVLFYHLYCCTAGSWVNDNCIGLWYIMCGRGLGTFASSKSGGVNDATHFYGPIGQYHSFGYAVMYWFNSFQPYDHDERAWTLGMLWLGDPTLTKMRRPPGAFSLTSPPNGADFSAPDILLVWESSIPLGADETVTYRLIVDDNEDFLSPELVVEDLPTVSYHITAADGLEGTEYYWKVEAMTNFGRVRASNDTRWFAVDLDSDHDGMANDWETDNGLDPNDPTDATLDPDGDLLTNREEAEFGSDPHDPNSPPMVYVDDDNAADPAQDGSLAHPYATIQAAIDAAPAPAVVKVLPGAYTGPLVMADGVWLIGSGSDRTRLASQAEGPTVYFSGVADGTIAGLGITAQTGNNSVSIRSQNSTVTVRDCTCTGGRNGIGVDYTGSVHVVGCVVARNTHVGIWCGGTALVNVVNTTIADNGQDGILRTGTGAFRIRNSILWGNGDDLDGGAFTMSYSDIGDGDSAGANGNISADPRFVYAADGNYRLRPGSPCIDAGTSHGAPSVDIDGRFCCDDPMTPNSGAGSLPFRDLGPYEFKAYYVNGNPAIGSDASDGLAPTPGSGHGPKLTIQAALNAAGEGDTVMVAPWTYSGGGNIVLNFAGKAITLIAQDGAATTTIDCVANGPGLYFHSGEGASSVVDGFTVTHGTGDHGGAIYCHQSGPTIMNCTLTGNSANHNGGAIRCYMGNPVIVNCTISNNTAGDNGGAISALQASPVITGCTIIGNTAYGNGGGIACEQADGSISRCRITANQAITAGGGLFFESSSSIVSNCTVTGNVADSHGGGVSFGASTYVTLSNCTITGNVASVFLGGAAYCDGGAPALTNCILWANSPDEVYVASGTPSLSHCDVAGGWTGDGGHNTGADPCFIDPGQWSGVWVEGDYHLQAGSPCIDSGCCDGGAHLPTQDMEGNGRVDDLNVADCGSGEPPYGDLGAYERQAGWAVQGVAQFNRDGRADILWRHATSGGVGMWLMNGLDRMGAGLAATVSPAAGWAIAGVGDFNRSGTADILWRNTSTGQIAVWLMDGLHVVGAGIVGTLDPASPWMISGVGDFDGDGRADVLWRNTSTGDVAVWLMNGTRLRSTGVVGTPSLDWEVRGTGDFDGDAKTDIAWRNRTTGSMAIWLMNGTAVRAGGIVATPAPAWRIEGTGDFDADGRADLLWRDGCSGQAAVWLMNGLSRKRAGLSGTMGALWVVRGIGDFDRDGKADVLWCHRRTGEVAVWLMNGPAIRDSGLAGTVAP